VPDAVGSSEAAPRPKKKYKSSTFTDVSLPQSKQGSKRGGSKDDAISDDDMRWLLYAVKRFDAAKDSSNKCNGISFENVLKIRLGYIGANVRKNLVGKHVHGSRTRKKCYVQTKI
jgi:hypothetical protein